MLKYAIFVHDTAAAPYALQIVRKQKPIETRTKNVFKSIISERVYIIRTYAGKKPLVIGSGTLSECRFYTAAQLDSMRALTRIPAGSTYDCKSPGKYGYTIVNPVQYKTPFPLANLPIVKRCRSYCTLETTDDSTKAAAPAGKAPGKAAAAGIPIDNSISIYDARIPFNQSPDIDIRGTNAGGVASFSK